MSKPDITERFASFSALLTREPFISAGTIELRCSGGGISRCDAKYEGEMLMVDPLIPPKYFQDRTDDLPEIFKQMVDHITGTRFEGVATLSARVFLGKVYKIKVGFNQEWQGV